MRQAWKDAQHAAGDGKGAAPPWVACARAAFRALALMVLVRTHGLRANRRDRLQHVP